MLVKICGITRRRGRRGWRSTLGAAAIGFVFWPNEPARSSIRIARARSPRRCRRSSTPVGVFVEPAADVRERRGAAWSRLGAVQLHGDETPATTPRRWRAPVIKAVARRDRRRGRCERVAGATSRCCSTRTIRCGAAAPGGRSTGRRRRRWRARRPSHAGRRADARQRRATRSRACGRSASTCRRASSGARHQGSAKLRRCSRRSCRGDDDDDA